MKALVVPGVTDLNKGDQALVWESHRLANDLGIFDSVSLLGAGDTIEEQKMMTGQSASAGYAIVESILKHPRRGVHLRSGGVFRKIFYLLFMIRNAIADFVFTLGLIFSGKFSFLRMFFSESSKNKLDAIVSHDVFFVKGGGFLHSYGEKRDPYVFWYLLFYINLARFHNKKVVVLPNSYGPFKSFGIKAQLRSALLGCSFISARENKSAEQLGSLIKKEIPVYPDLGFFLNSDKSGREALERLGVSFLSKVIGITVRPWRFPESDNPRESYRTYIHSISEFIEYQVSLGNEVVLINQSLGPNVNEDDRNAIADVLEALTSNRNVYWLNQNLPCSTLHAIYSELDFLLGTRFHSVIFSLSSSVPCVAIAYGGNKGQGIMQDAGLSSYVIDIAEVKPDALIERYESCMANRELVTSKISAYMETCFAYRGELIERIKQSIF